jgi:hypothetical protein
MLAAWRQKAGAFFDETPVVGIRGYEPQRWVRQKPSNSVVEANKVASSAAFKLLTGKVLPKWFPRHADGYPITHFYRLIANETGVDVRHPPVASAMSHRMQEPAGRVDFSDLQVKETAIMHVDKMSEGNFMRRPFLSASSQLEVLLPFGNSKVRHTKPRMKWWSKNLPALTLLQCSMTGSLLRSRSLI